MQIKNILGLRIFVSVITCFAATAVSDQMIPSRRVESSLGQLTKRAQAVVVGKIAGIETNEMGVLSIHFRNSTSILGAPTPSDVSFELGLTKWLGQRQLLVGSRALLFVSSIEFDAENFRSFRFDYFAQFPGKEPRYIMAGHRGILQEDNAKLAEIADVVEAYWSQLRSETRDPVAYAKFLAELREHEIELIRKDAASDLRILIRFVDIATLEQLLTSVAFESDTLASIERILQWKKDGKPRVVRDWHPTEDDWIRWISLLESCTRAQKLAALADLLQPERRKIVLKSSDRWHVTVASLLESSEEDVRLWAAVLLSHVSDERALGPLIDGLQSDVGYRREAAWEALKLISEGAAPSFDQNASIEVRQQAIERIKEWRETK